MKLTHQFAPFLIIVFLAGCDSSPDSPETTAVEKVTASETVPLALAPNAETIDAESVRYPYFGQTHQHTGWSFDEAIYNVRHCA